MAHKVIVFYDGEWKIADGVSSFVSSSSQGVTVPQNTTYAELVDIIYDAINVDKFRYDLVLKVKYNMPGIQNSPPTVIKRDMDVMFYLEETSTSLQHRTPLCVSLVEKSLRTNPTQESKIGGVVPEIDDPDIFPMFQQDVFENQNDILENQAEEGSCLRLNESDLVASTGVAHTPGEPITSHCSITSTQSERLGSYENASIENPIPTTLTSEIELEVSTLLENKKKLQLRLYKYAMANHFEFKVDKSSKELLYVKCLDEKCKWRLRAVKEKFSEMFEIRKFVQEHTCSILTRQEGKRHAPSWVIGECMKDKYMDHHHDHMPKKIIEDMQRSYGIKMSYSKAWKCREKALMAVRGTVEDSYGKLPSYLYMLEMNNPGTITDIQTDELSQFRYMFISLGVSIKGFTSSCRPVLCIDASFLKHKVGGQLLVAIALDANEQLYPVAFGIVDSENNNSWTYFMQKLREAIGSVPNLVFVSDRHPSIVNALSAVFPEADHGACTYRIKMNIMAKFKTNNCHTEFDLASRAYTVSKFHMYFDKIKVKDPRIAAYLEEIGLERWSRAFFPGKRYNQLTSNYVESFISQSRNARKYLITTLTDYLRLTLQEWFHNRKEEASNHTGRLSQYYEKFLCEQAEKARFYNVHPLNRFQFYVHDGESDFRVDFKALTCSCRVFDVSGLPCAHALAATQKLDAYDFCSRYYSTEAWLNAYAETYYPVCNESVWDIPENIKQRVCLKPPIKVKKGRPITKRKSFQGEPRKVRRRRCSLCGDQGHNRSTCSAVMPTPSTARASSSRTQPLT